ncbi:DNA-packaging protein [Jannaschia sp. W003]|uniref:DNA-packaging protein n=1 Tax=Jannaschia sp. W003 TaxID=2867012 RepID=UPI0021A2CA21|nr:terminase family protein [Jannaschia sp. W003]UWQ23066.1 terminase family protein [Jannaschia sp. W003]
MRCAAGWLASGGPEAADRLLAGLSDNALAALPWLWPFWAMAHQLPPDGAWRTWVVLGGRGAGKTRAGAEWVRGMVEGDRPLDPGRARRVALVGETYEQAVRVMIEGESGLLACSPPDRRPEWKATARKLVWPNGAEAWVYSAHDPEALRGPQFDAAWCDELAKWPKAAAAWAQLRFCLRLGDDPRAVVTTTPRNVAVLRDLLAAPDTVRTHAPTDANRAWLAPGFVETVRRQYGGTRFGRQELDGELLEEVEGAFWSLRQLDGLRGEAPEDFERVVIGVDPAVTGGAGSDATGIVVVGVERTPEGRRAWVLEDATVAGRPAVWADAVAAASRRWGADRVVAEGNQGGELIEQVLRQVAPDLSYRRVTARRSKGARAEPVSALYEQGRVRHAGTFRALEDEMAAMTARGFRGAGSPDRVDALVWALWAALIEPARAGPTIRHL